MIWIVSCSWESILKNFFVAKTVIVVFVEEHMFQWFTRHPFPANLPCLCCISCGDCGGWVFLWHVVFCLVSQFWAWNTSVFVLQAYFHRPIFIGICLSAGKLRYRGFLYIQRLGKCFLSLSFSCSVFCVVSWIIEISIVCFNFAWKTDSLAVLLGQKYWSDVFVNRIIRR